MNDGISQDPWDMMLQASSKLRNVAPERFGVALGDEIDLRELHHYIGDDSRIYRDGETERCVFMSFAFFATYFFIVFLRFCFILLFVVAEIGFVLLSETVIISSLLICF